MDISSNTLLILAVILFFGLIVPQFFKKLALPFASSLIVLGALLGPNGFDYVKPDETMTLFGFLGATFQMLLAGFETETLNIKKTEKRVWGLIILNMLLPFFAGVGIVKFFGYSWATSIFMGLVFISSSVMMVFSDVKNLNLEETRLGQSLKSLVVIHDFTSAVLIFLIFKSIEPHSRFPLPILLGLIVSSVIILRMFLPEVVSYFFQRFEKTKAGYEAELRLILALFFLVLLVYSALDVNSIIAAFLIGFTLSEIPRAHVIKLKLNTIGYALFIPVYLFILGVKLDFSVLNQIALGNYGFIAVILGLLGSKWISGFFGGKWAKFTSRESVLIGILTSTKLTVTVSSAFVALNFNLIDTNLYTAIILLTVITVVVNPILASLFIQKKPMPEHD